MPTLNLGAKRKANYPKHNKNAEIAKIYNTTQWKNLRKAYLMTQPLCEKCLEEGRITKATQVHHIYEISNGSSELEMKDIAYNPDNLQALCEDCHRLEHLNRKKGGRDT